MRLVDIMSSLHLTSYPEIGLVLFLGAFVCVAIELFVSRKNPLWSAASRMPLELEDGESEDANRDA